MRHMNVMTENPYDNPIPRNETLEERRIRRNLEQRWVYQNNPEKRERIKRTSREHYAKNKEEHGEYTNNYRLSHPEKWAEYIKKWQQNNREHINAYQRAYYAANKESLAKYRKEMTIWKRNNMKGPKPTRIKINSSLSGTESS